MEENNLFTKNNCINTSYDKTEYLSCNICDSLIIKDNNIINNNILLESFNPELNDKNINNINIFKSYDDEDPKIFTDSFMKSDRETLYKSKKININDFKELNNEDIKKQLKLKRNRESAKKGRLRKKLYIQNLIIENNFLKIKYKNLLNIIHKCPKCKQNLELCTKNDDHKKICEKENENNIISELPNVSNKKKLLFATTIAIISIINIFNIPLNIMNYYKSIYNNNIEYLRKLNNNYNQNYTIIDNFKNDKNILINKLSTTNGDNEALYIHLAEFYSITKREKINLKKIDFKQETNKNIKVFHENQINIDQISQNNLNDCVKCVVEVDKKSIKLGGDEFTFYLANRHLSKFFENNNQDGIFPKINFNENSKKYDSFSKFFALKCKILAYSINDLYSEKIENI